jgi:hypothetical protein
MSKQNKQGKDFIPLKINPDHVRFSDCCNAIIIGNRCPKCGAWLDDNQGRREIKIQGLDGRTTHGQSDVLLSVIDDKPKAKDQMPRHFKEMERHGTKITSWSDSTIS